MLVQALIAELAVKAFDVGILIRFSRSNERQVYVRVIRPHVEHLAFELRAVIDGDGLRQPAGLGQ